MNKATNEIMKGVPHSAVYAISYVEVNGFVMQGVIITSCVVIHHQSARH